MRLTNNVVAILTADTHVDDYAWANRPAICGDSKWSFQWLCELAAENRVPLIIAGDLLDKQQNGSGPIGFLRQQYERDGLQILFNQGQHDMQSAPWLQAVSQGKDDALWLHKTTTQLYSKTNNEPVFNVYGLDWTPAGRLQEELAAVPEGTDILVLHQVTQEFMGSITTPEMTLASVPHARIVLIGDYHKHRMPKVIGASGQEIQVLSPGSTNMREISEPARKTAFLLLEGGNVMDIDIPTRGYLYYDVPNEEALNGFVQRIATDIQHEKDKAINLQLPTELHHPLVRVRFDPVMAGAYERISNAVSEKQFLFTAYYETEEVEQAEELIDESADQQLQEQLEEVGVAACLPEAVSPTEETEVFNLCHRLLTEPNALNVLAEERAKYINI